uniref:Uncharacterized protein n=1 Tax=Parascaris univalens TaxID=6257 RepID=A0A915C8D5_PARUN
FRAVHACHTTVETVHPTLLEKRIALLERFQGQSLRLDRKLTAEVDKKCAEIRVFVDASTSAYSAVGYLRSYSQDRYENSLLMSKSRVAPIRGITIPRFELMAALIGSRLLNFVKRQLMHTGPTFLWSDSQATLHWIATATTGGPVSSTIDSPKYAEALHSSAMLTAVITPRTWQHVVSQLRSLGNTVS